MITFKSQNGNTMTPRINDTFLIQDLMRLRNATNRVEWKLNNLKIKIADRDQSNFYTGKFGNLYRRADYVQEVKNVEAIAIASKMECMVTTLEELTELQDVVNGHNEWINELEANYDAHKWSRFFLVVSSSGHIHSNMNCHTCNKGMRQTQFTLFPSLSGCTSEEAVARLGSALCSVCFPNAPVAHREQTKISQAAAEALANTGFESNFDEVINKQIARAAKRLAKAGK